MVGHNNEALDGNRDVYIRNVCGCVKSDFAVSDNSISLGE